MEKEATKIGVFEQIRKQLEKLSGFMNLSEKEVNLLLDHKQISHAIIKVNGKNYEAWRVLHNNALGPGKGGIRFHPGVSEDEVKSLSFWMSLKTSLLGLPYGGAKGGVIVNPKELSETEIEALSREYIRAFHEVLGEDKDVPAPDVYTNSKIMAWMLDEFERIKKRHEPGFITGKPIELGGLKLRGDSTAKGGFIILKEFLQKIKKDKSEIKIAVQGFGNAGLNIAKMLAEDGFKIVAISDSKGGVCSQGLDLTECIRVKNECDSVQEIKNTEKISNQDLLKMNVDLLILAALENQITLENAEQVRAKYILELANGPVSADADKILFDKGITVIPDILANAGGVLVSYFEWAQNKAGNILDEDFLKQKLNKMMIEAFEKVYELYSESNKELSMRNAAYVISIRRILDAEKLRGNL